MPWGLTCFHHKGRVAGLLLDRMYQKWYTTYDSTHFKAIAGTVLSLGWRTGACAAMVQEPGATGSKDHRGRYQGCRAFGGDVPAAGALAWPRTVGSPKQLAAWPYRPRDFLR